MKRVIGFLFLISYSLFLIPACSISKKISQQADKILLQDSVINTGHIGISIYEPSTNKYWYNYNDEKYFIPASNTKLFTLYAGMKYLGDSLTGGVYKEDEEGLRFIGNADPTFLHPDFLKQPIFDFFKTHSNKRIALCQRIPIFQDMKVAETWGKGWAWDDFNSSYMRETNFFPLYGNLAKFRLTNNKVTVTPSYFNNKIFQPERKISSFFVERTSNDNFFFIQTDTLNNQTDEVPYHTGLAGGWVPIEDSLLSDTLHRVIDFLKVGLRSLDGYHRVYSQPTDSLLKPMMHNSDNFFAEQTLLMVSNEQLGYMSDEDIIDTLLKKDLADIPQNPRWVDGSGLSRYNLFTPKSFVYILSKMQNEFGLQRLKNILPTGGEGTLQNYYINDSAYIYAKTGSLSNNNALSGFLITKKNKLLIFSILVNNFQGKAASVRRRVEMFIETIRQKY